MTCFKRVGRTHDNIVVFYSSPNKSTQDDGILEYMKQTIGGAQSWIWIFNCSEMTSKQCANIKLALDISSLIQHTPGCRGVYVQNSTWAVKKLLDVLKSMLPITLTCRLFVDKTPPTFFPDAT